MPKKTLLLLLVLCLTHFAKAQTADAVYNQYLDFNMARFHGDLPKSLKLGEGILPNADKLPAKSRIGFYNGIAKVYEDSNQPDKAVPYYELVAAAEPDFYVAHRALGYLYLIPAKQLNDKLQSATPGTADWKQLFEQYKMAVLKALPHLEKAQACDPSDETLALIKLSYRNINDTAALQSLNARLAELGKNCVDVLSE
jgi:tetratricopeptide (TPR) repeat protein